MSGNDFYDKGTRITAVDSPSFEGGVHVTEPELRTLMSDILIELRMINVQLATMTDNDPEDLRRDIHG